MITKSIEAEGINCDDAIEKALRMLGMDRDDVSVEVLTVGKRGIFRSTPAKVRVSYEVPEPVKAPEPAPVIEPEPKKENIAVKPEPKKEVVKKTPHKPVQPSAQPPVKPPVSTSGPAYVSGTALPKEQISQVGEQAANFIDGLLVKLGVEGHAEILDSSNDEHLQVEIVGPNMGPVIGRRGDTLDAIQYLTMLVVTKDREEHIRVSVDTEGYRAKREESLTRLARKMAAKVARYRKSMTLEPMNPYERRIIHAALQDFRGVTTFSTGTEPGRRVVIAPEGQNTGRSTRGGTAPRGDRRR